MLPLPTLSPDNIRKIEEEVLLLCRHCKTSEEIVTAGKGIWEWSAQALAESLDELRSEVESHYMDEKFPDLFQEEKDHLLKIPVVLLEHLHRSPS